MHILLISGLFQTNSIWDNLVKNIDKDIDYTFYNLYNDDITKLDSEITYTPITISYGYRVFLNLSGLGINFTHGLHINPAIQVDKIKLYSVLFSKLIYRTPKKVVLDPIIFNLSNYLTGDNFWFNPELTHSNIKHKDNFRLIEDMEDDIKIKDNEDIFLFGNKDNLVRRITTPKSIEFECGHHGVYYSQNLIEYIISFLDKKHREEKCI